MSGEFKSVLEDGPIEGEPLVSVCVITYNHGKYIRQCLDGILMQKVNFPYEVLIHDDASPDDTADIIREYWEKYPTVIKPILREENQYSKGVDVSRFNFDRAKAKYIAQCEGDDYWTDDGKLQMQVDFLEEHGEYVECGHNIIVLEEGRINEKHPASRASERIYTFSDLADGKRWMVATASAVYRNVFLELSENKKDDYYSCTANGDLKLQLLLSQYGDCYMFKKQMSVYRYIISTGTSYNARMHGKNTEKIRYDYYLSAVNFMKKSFGIDLNWKDLFNDTIYWAIINWVRYFKRNRKENTDICVYILKDYKRRYGTLEFLKTTCLLTPKYIVKKCMYYLNNNK